MIFTRRFIASAKVAIALVLVLILACSCTPEPEVPAGQAPLVNMAPEPSSQQQEDQPIPGGDLYVSIPNNPTTFHPLGISDEDMFNLMSMVFEPAVRMLSDGSFAPSVIESWEINDDGTIYTFKIRKDVSFHSDRGIVTASDLAFVMGLLAGDKQDAENSDENDVDQEGNDDVAFVTPYADYADVITSYSVVDAYTLRVVATHKTSDVLRFMGFPVMSQSYYTGMNFESLSVPIGTGPFYMASNTEDEITLLPNENWWKREPYINKVVALGSESEEVKLANFQLDLFNCVGTSSITANNYRSISDTDVYSSTTYYYDTLIPNMRDDIMRDVTVRQAMSLAIDRREIINAGLLGEGVATITPLRPDVWYFDDIQKEAVENNVAQANEMLDAASWTVDQEGMRSKDGTPLEITLIFSESEEYYYREVVANMLKEQLALIGMNVNIAEYNTEEFEELIKNKTFDVALTSFYMKSNNDLTFMLDDNAEFNYGEYASVELMTLMDDANSSITDEEHITSFTALEEYLRTELPHIGLYYKEHSMLVDADIAGITGIAYMQMFSGVSDWYFDYELQ